MTPRFETLRGNPGGGIPRTSVAFPAVLSCSAASRSPSSPRVAASPSLNVAT
ncbi:hypothetical protein HEB94_003159 [Actinopolymorpha pittospori]|uniref:Uncharacterized protein n=1 Tax=Actinopolymorpha pittospori TaxID=648752 RepID=A0A927MTZ5_9ACTN|nr:hypothetical protein [Actinopolymorpha pittospori]